MWARERVRVCVCVCRDKRALQTLPYAGALRRTQTVRYDRKSESLTNRVLLSECSQELPHQNVVHGVQGLQVRGQYNE